MATEIHPPTETAEAPKKRKFKHKKLINPKKKMMKTKKGMEASRRENPRPKVRNSKKMTKLFQKRAREYNSDEDEEENDEPAPEFRPPNPVAVDGEERSTGNSSEGEGANDLDARDGEEEEEGEGGSEDEGDEIQPGITKFVEGCRAFRVAFLKIMKKNVSNDMLGPVLSGHKKLIAEKLAEEDEERKVKGEAKKEKHLISEKGHVKPASFLDTKEKFLISVATKGVVKLFNAVNKAQNAQKGLNPSRSKDAKALGKRRKEAFYAELRKTSDNPSLNAAKGAKYIESENKDEPTWAPLRDSFSLTNSKLKDWDKMPDPATSSIPDEIPLEDSSDDE